MSRIFVGIAAYNEPDLKLTIESALLNAAVPERVYFGIAKHYNDGTFPDLSMYKNVKVIGVEYPSPFSTTLSRLLALSLMTDEEYYLQIDAHMLFEPDWDSHLIEMHKEISSKNGKSVISTRLSPWYWSKDKQIVKNGNLLGGILGLSDQLELHAEQRHPMSEAYPYSFSESEDYVEHFLMSGHFIFASSDYIKEVSPDPFLVFAGEEQTLSIRTYTRGYKIFALKNNVIWHKTKTEGLKYKFDWRQDERFKDTKEKAVFWYNTEKAILRVTEILRGDWFGYYGAKDLHSYNKFCDALNIDFKKLYDQMFELSYSDTDKYQGTIALINAYKERQLQKNNA